MGLGTPSDEGATVGLGGVVAEEPVFVTGREDELVDRCFDSDIILIAVSVLVQIYLYGVFGEVRDKVHRIVPVIEVVRYVDRDLCIVIHGEYERAVRHLELPADEFKIRTRRDQGLHRVRGVGDEIVDDVAVTEGSSDTDSITDHSRAVLQRDHVLRALAEGVVVVERYHDGVSDPFGYYLRVLVDHIRFDCVCDDIVIVVEMPFDQFTGIVVPVPVIEIMTQPGRCGGRSADRGSLRYVDFRHRTVHVVEGDLVRILRVQVEIRYEQGVVVVRVVVIRIDVPSDEILRSDGTHRLRDRRTVGV